MDEPKALDSLFTQKLFRIPDYQRGYAWRREQLTAFWEDLFNLPDGRFHYTGVLTLKEIESHSIVNSEKEYWLVEDHSYRLYHIVDGPQRLATFVIVLQAFVDFLTRLPENDGKSEREIYLTGSLTVESVCRKYLFKVKPTGDRFRTYKFGYTKDNPSDQYLRYHIFNEPGGGLVPETFYTLNLDNAKRFFDEQIRGLHQQAGPPAIAEVYQKLTKRFLFNEYIIKDEFNIFVAFETMNNRGKTLSDLELLKNRLIYLTTLYTDHELDPADRKGLRDTINDAWKEVYHQLGRNKDKPLNDDDFLRAHWIMYFMYSRKTGRDYIRFLLDKQFTPQRVHRKVVSDVSLVNVEEQTSEADFVDDDTEIGDEEDDAVTAPSAHLAPMEISDFVNSLKASSVQWFNSFYPDLADGLSDEEKQWINRLNRVAMFYFRPLVMAILKNIELSAERIELFQAIERFIFIVFRMSSTRSNYGSSEFYNAARALDRHGLTGATIVQKLEDRMSFAFHDDGQIHTAEFYGILRKKFDNDKGYYGWAGLRYFLFEYETSLLLESRQQRVDWGDLLKSERDKISIEHIYPQTDTAAWHVAFGSLSSDEKVRYKGSLGNLLLLSAAINSSLQNDSFADKKKAKVNAAGEKIRNGYSDGSHSEIEVSECDQWGPEQVRARGLKLLQFMERRWQFRCRSNDEREALLFLNVKEDT